MPEREDDHLTPATRLLEKRREMSEVEQALAAQKEACTYVIILKPIILNYAIINSDKLLINILVW